MAGHVKERDQEGIEMCRATAQEVLVDAFEETGLVLGGIFAVHEVDDEVIWQTAKSLSVIYRKARDAIRSADSEPPSGPPERKPEPHPAILEFLTQLQRDRNGASGRRTR